MTAARTKLFQHFGVGEPQEPFHQHLGVNVDKNLHLQRLGAAFEEYLRFSYNNKDSPHFADEKTEEDDCSEKEHHQQQQHATRAVHVVTEPSVAASAVPDKTAPGDKQTNVTGAGCCVWPAMAAAFSRKCVASLVDYKNPEKHADLTSPVVQSPIGAPPDKATNRQNPAPASPARPSPPQFATRCCHTPRRLLSCVMNAEVAGFSVAFILSASMLTFLGIFALTFIHLEAMTLDPVTVGRTTTTNVTANDSHALITTATEALEAQDAQREWVMIVGSFGAQAVILFGATGVPFAQPWNSLVGNVISAFIGVSCRYAHDALIDDLDAGIPSSPASSSLVTCTPSTATSAGTPTTAYACSAAATTSTGGGGKNVIKDIQWFWATLAVTLSLIAMLLTDSLHPPGGATAMIAVMSGRRVQRLRYYFLIFPIGLGTILFILMTYIWGAFFTNDPARRYPKLPGLKGWLPKHVHKYIDAKN